MIAMLEFPFTENNARLDGMGLIVASFRRIRNLSERLLSSFGPSIGLSACTHGTTREYLDRFSLNLTLENFVKDCRAISVLLFIKQF
jgi:hypothetical protein